jgi:hypothetical protein
MLKYKEVLFIFFHTLQIYYNVINEHYDKLVQLGIKTEFMRYMKCGGAFVKPNDMTRFSKRPYLVVKAILGISGMNLDLVIAGAEINLGEHMDSH